jgi:SAM-dependent methyltransferase
MPVAAATFDVTVSVSTLQYMPIPEVVENCRRALRPGGVSVFIENLAGNPVAKVDRLRRRVLRIPEPPTMRIRRHLELGDLTFFRRVFNGVTAEVWYDWSTVLLPFLAAPPLVRRVVAAAVLRTGRATPTSAWRARFGWIVSIEARV